MNADQLLDAATRIAAGGTAAAHLVNLDDVLHPAADYRDDRASGTIHFAEVVAITDSMVDVPEPSATSWGAPRPGLP